MSAPWPIPFKMVVDHVYDGDTIVGVVLADAGLDVWVTFGATNFWRLRLWGINCPEMKTDEGKECKAVLESLVQPGDVLLFDSYSFDNYGKRIDGKPYTADGTDLCGAMLQHGPGTVTM